VEQVDQETQFQEVVEWNESKDDSSELVNNVEGTEAHPICQPLLVIIDSLCLKGQEAHECWISNTKEISNV